MLPWLSCRPAQNARTLSCEWQKFGHVAVSDVSFSRCTARFVLVPFIFGCKLTWRGTQTWRFIRFPPLTSRPRTLLFEIPCSKSAWSMRDCIRVGFIRIWWTLQKPAWCAFVLSSRVIGFVRIIVRGLHCILLCCRFLLRRLCLSEQYCTRCPRN